MSARLSRKSRTLWIVVGSLLVLAVALVFYSLDWGGKPVTPRLTLAQVPTPDSALPIIAEENGYFREEGLTVAVKEFTSGKLCFDAMLGGGADLCTVAETPLMFAGFSNQPVAVLTTIMSSDQSVKLLARSDKGVTTPEDLRGKQVGTFKGSSAEYFLAEFLLQHGMTLGDVRVTYMQPPELVTAIIRGNLSAISMWEPNIYTAEKALGDRALIFTDAKLYTETLNIASLQSFAESNGDRVSQFLRALLRAEAFLKAAPEAAR